MAVDVRIWHTVAVTVARVGAVAAAAVVVSGVPLIWLYEPDGGASWLTGLHRLSGTLLLGAAAGLVVAAVGAAAGRHRIGVPWPLAVAALAVAVAGSITGQLIGWDQVAVSAVDAPDTTRGVFAAIGDDVRFVLVGGTELSPGTFLALVVAHLVAVPAAAVGLGWWWWRSRHREPASVPPPA
jgi:hypothetical protein